jgi:transposase-like protein
MQCPNCRAEDLVKNGRMHHGKQKFLCKNCGRQFVEHPEKKTIAPETKALMDKLLLEKIPLAGIARVTGVSARWWQQSVNQKYAEIPQQVDVKPKKKPLAHGL